MNESDEHKIDDGPAVDNNGWTIKCMVHPDRKATMWGGHAHVGSKKITCGWCHEKCSYGIKTIRGFEMVSGKRHGGCYGYAMLAAGKNKGEAK